MEVVAAEVNPREISSMSEIFPHLDYKPQLPKRLDRGIGMVGAGGIVNYAHLPAYKNAGFRVAGITDRNREQAEKTAKRHDIPKVYATLDDLLAESDIEIVDVAIYPAEQVESCAERLPPASIYFAKSRLLTSMPRPSAAWNSPKKRK